MNLGLAGRMALVVGPKSPVGRACADALGAEGATVREEQGATAPDIVVAHGVSRPASSLLDRTLADGLRQAWGDVAGTVDAYRAAIDGMRTRRWGRFVWVGTALAKSLDADDDELGAVVSLGIMGLHKVVAAEEGPSNVTANAVLLGGRATPEDAASAVAFLCSEGAGYLSGVTFTIDGGTGSAVF